MRDARRPWFEQRDARDNQNLTLLMRFWLRSDSNCIDIGANQGAILRQIVELAPRGSHLAFEPIPSLAARLCMEFPSVEIRQIALADRSGTAEFVHVLNYEGRSGLREQDYPGEAHIERIDVRLGRLDDCLPEGYRPDFIKIDVEGAERDVFLGGLTTIATFRPIIVFEHSSLAESYGTGPADVHDLLVGEAGLEIYDIDGIGPLSRQQMVDVVNNGKIWNYVARAAPGS